MTTRQPKPPKPNGVAASPRFKDRKPPERIAAVLERVRRLIEKTDSPSIESEEELAVKARQVSSRLNDRGAAIILGADVDRALEQAIIGRLRIHDGELRELFRSNGPLGTFSNKITMGYALDIFGPVTKSNLDIIRTVRNTFAHASRPITFLTEEISIACSLLEIPELQVFNVSIKPKTPKNDAKGNRQRYVVTCKTTELNLILRRITRPDQIDDLDEESAKNYVHRLGSLIPLP